QQALLGQGLTPACGTRREPASHDNLFHTEMGLLQIRSAVYQPSLDLFAPCRPATQARPASRSPHAVG
ncbi:MAG: hypothetical protein P8008_02585, partial [Gammaproteobacteria bacterium]